MKERATGSMLTGIGLASVLLDSQMTDGRPWVAITAGSIVLVVGLLMAVFGA